MKITAIKAIIVSLPVRHTGYLGVGMLERVDNVLVVIETDAGINGYGESAPWPCFAENAWSVRAAIDHLLGPALVGRDPWDIEQLLLDLDTVLYGYSFAKAALEIALWDIAGKDVGKPIYALLGGKVRASTPISYSIANQDIRKDLEEIKWLLDESISVFKIKAGVLDFAREVERIEAIRRFLPTTVDMRIDFNQGLKRELGIKTCRALEAYSPTFMEQPVKGWDLDAMAAIAAAIETPIMADESVFSIQDAVKIVTHKAADMASIKLMKMGGITRAKKAAAVFEAAGMPCYAGAMWESSVGIAAGLHVTASTPNVTYGSDYYVPRFLLVDDLVVEPLRTDAGHIFVPEGPGLGIEIDWEIVERYAQRP